MSESGNPTSDDTEGANEVEAHAALPADLQKMTLRDGGQDDGLVMGSSMSIIC